MDLANGQDGPRLPEGEWSVNVSQSTPGGRGETSVPTLLPKKLNNSQKHLEVRLPTIEAGLRRMSTLDTRQQSAGQHNTTRQGKARQGKARRRKARRPDTRHLTG